MIKRTLFFGNPVYLSTRLEQLIIKYPNSDKKSTSVPIEDISFVVLENSQITITNSLLTKLAQNKSVVFTCDERHLPCSLISPIVGHTQQSQRIRHQVNASLPLKKQLWKQTVISKIENQANLLRLIGKNPVRLNRLSKKVKSGDSENCEAIAAAFYFQNLFNLSEFSRNQKGIPPNNLLNYGYSILRGITARAIVGSGLLATVGLKHQNKYNPFCLADDIMEPYRPFVDSIVVNLVESGMNIKSLNAEIKSELLKTSSMDVLINKKRSPLMIAMSITTNSLFESFAKIRRKIIYPEFPIC
ncbi:MAG: type II CRISPR-associated endonuclease Cas1 [Flavobacteriaceae bacterium]|nr:type II CRISPR-associated endonuclease Cas1 [Flavobacteriaceae bacterium]